MFDILDEEHKQKAVNLLREQGAYYNSPDICLGKIVSINPLQINYKNTPLNRNRLLISKHLLDWTETVESTTSTEENHSHSVTAIKHKSMLNVGDTVVLYEIEKNKKFLVLEVVI